jgi:hypothetical protein
VVCGAGNSNRGGEGAHGSDRAGLPDGRSGVVGMHGHGMHTHILAIDADDGPPVAIGGHESAARGTPEQRQHLLVVEEAPRRSADHISVKEHMEAMEPVKDLMSALVATQVAERAGDEE